MLCALEFSVSLIVNLEGLNEVVPSLRGELTRMLKTTIETFLRQTEKSDLMILAFLKTTTTYQQLLIESADIKVSVRG